MDISKAIGSVYGADAEKAFLPLWRKHIGFVVDYTVGIATQGKTKQDKAVAICFAMRRLRRFLSSANPNLPKSAVAELVKGHVVTLKDVVDAQAAKEWPMVYSNLRTASSHMAMIADRWGWASRNNSRMKYAALEHSEIPAGWGQPALVLRKVKMKTAHRKQEGKVELELRFDDRPIVRFEADILAAEDFARIYRSRPAFT